MTVTNLVVARRLKTRLIFVIGVLDVAVRFGDWLQEQGWKVEVMDSLSVNYRSPTLVENMMIQALTHEYEEWCAREGQGP